MFFRTAKETREVAELAGFLVKPSESSIRAKGVKTNTVRMAFAEARGRHYALAQMFKKWLQPTNFCLLWVTEYGVWPSSENLHLYYTVRRAFGDYRSIAEAPGHYFLRHEEAELVTFLDLTVQFGWGALVFGAIKPGFLTVSHDEWAIFQSTSSLSPIIEEATEFGLICQTGGK